MKKLFNLRAGALVLGLVLAFAGSAFTPADSETAAAGQSWFLYTGGEIEDPDNYTEIGSEPTHCPGDGVLCAILTEEDQNSGKPTSDGVMDPDAEKRFE